MTRKEIYEKIQMNFFNDNIEYTIEKLGEELKYFYPVFGTLKVEIEDKEASLISKPTKTIKYIDEEFIKTLVDGKTGETKELDVPEDVSSIIIEMDIDENGTIIFVENGVCFLTKSNKDLTLFSASLIGKKIT